MTTKRLLCLVTDRRRLANALGRASSASRALLLEQLEGAVRGGVDLVQIREHDLEAAELARLVRDVLRIAHGTPTRVVVNDRLDVALATGAHGVHLRESSFEPAAVRSIAPGLLVGRSVHSADRAARADRADYLIAGTVFRTHSKSPSMPLIGAEGLKTIVQAAGGTPVLGIGGIAEEGLSVIAGAGAQGIAAIGAFLPASNADDIVQAVENKVKILRFTFDTA